MAGVAARVRNCSRGPVEPPGSESEEPVLAVGKALATSAAKPKNACYRARSKLYNKASL